MNDLQLFYYYQTIPLTTIHKSTRIYPKYVVITGRSISHPHPHRHYTFEEFMDKLNEDPNLRNIILNK